MRIRSVLFLLASCLLIWAPPSMAQKRIYARVNPNTAATNSSADAFEPSTSGIRLLADPMTNPRSGYASVLLKDGRVLIAGGSDGHNLKTAEVFNPTTGKFTETENTMNSARNKAASVLLQDGRAMIIGGYTGVYLASTELFNPADDTFSSGASLTSSRQNATATLLSNGKVLVAGGFNGAYLNSAELYDPTAGTFSNTGSLTTSRDGHTATLLPDGTVLIVGGRYLNSSTNNIIYLTSAEIYNPATAEFKATTGTMKDARSGHTATLLTNGRVLITGGYNGTALASSEIYDPATGSFTSTGAMGAARQNHGATILNDGKVLVAGGSSDRYLATVEIFDPGRGTFSTLTSTMSVPRSGINAVLIKDGRVLLAGGQNTAPLTFDVNDSQVDNIPPNVVFSADSKTGFVPYAGSGVVLAFSVDNGRIIKQISTGGRPASLVALKDGKTLAAVSVLENKIFLIGMDTLSLKGTYTFANASFGFASILTLSPDGTRGYISSGGTGEVIKFDIATGSEQARLKGMQTPGQVTVTPDGSILVAVDLTKTELVFAETGTMTAKYRTTFAEKYPSANFTAANKPVLSPDGLSGIIGSQDLGSSVLSKNTAYIFKTSTGEILTTEEIGYQPGYTAITPDGKTWIVLNQFSISFIPISDPNSVRDVSTVQGEPLPFSTVAVTQDSKYVFYPSSTTDLVFQQDIASTAVVGQYQAGDLAESSLDQASSVALTPDGKVFAVVTFMSDEIDLFTDSTRINLVRFKNSSTRFTGLTLLNTSPADTANLIITAFKDNGAALAASDSENPNLVNPVYLQLGPNRQISTELGQLFNLNLDFDNIGWLEIRADLNTIAGFTTLGQMRPTWFGAYLSRQDGQGLADPTDQVHDWIVPEVFSGTGDSFEMDFLNANYNRAEYTITRYSPAGAVIETKSATSMISQSRSTVKGTDVISQPNQKKVILIGGTDGAATLNSADIFDPSASSISGTSNSMNVPRLLPSVTQMQNGKVLISGGKNATAILNNAEVWDPVTNSFTLTAARMNSERFRHTSTRLANGLILLAGGQNSTSVNQTAEIYDPLNDNFVAAKGNMKSPRDAHSANLLAGGKVLLAGGIDGNASTASAELYDPETSQFSSTGSMNVPRAFHCSVTLPSGRILIAGGYNGYALNSAEIYDPSTGRFTNTGNMTEARTDFACTVLNNGTVLLAGGNGASGVLKTAEIYDPDAGRFQPTFGSMSETRSFLSATLIESSGLVLIAGGTDGTTASKTIELYDPTTQLFAKSSAEMSSKRQSHTAAYLQPGGDGYVRVSAPVGLQSYEFYEYGTTGTAFRGIEVAKYGGVQYLYSPQFAIVPGFSTILNLINGNQTTDADVVLRLYRPDGSILGNPVRTTIRKNGQLKGDLFDIFGNDRALLNSTGWLEVYSSTDRVVGTIAFTNAGQTFLAPFELSAKPMKDFIFTLAPEDLIYQTAVAMLNVSGQTANVRIELWDSDGAIIQSTTVSLPSGSRSALYLSDYFPGLSPQLRGNIRIYSNQPLHSFSLVHDRALRFMTAVPPTALR